MTKKAIIIGATSGIGKEVAKGLLNDGWTLGIAGRREEELLKLQAEAPEKIAIQVLDVTQSDSPQKLEELITKTDGMDLFFLASGIGRQNRELQLETELKTVTTNAEGFTRMVVTAFNYFKNRQQGHIAVISSIAGTRGLGAAAAYSATKRYQSTYIQALAQLAHIQKYNICFTDIRPGFVATPLLDDGRKYPMLMMPEKVAEEIIRAIKKRKRAVVIDWKYSILVFFWKLIPRCLWERLQVKTD
ncbi:MAG: SDR family NAD(P)-dependent oxidoreductase [Bacteroidales bacterium]|jgi:short-subunit dehydrogenase|nr:SDR family NAD(P)-dependent oxidoreductase [Bacteroidales bacterium]